MAGASVAVNIADLQFDYPDGTRALRGVSLQVAEGERLALLGANGAGKSTLLLHLNGILGPWAGASGAGTVTVADTRLERRTLAEARRRVGIVFQDPDDQLFMPTVARDVAFGPANLRLTASEIERRVGWALAAVGLGAGIAVEVLELDGAAGTDDVPERFREGLRPRRVVRVEAAQQQVRHQLDCDDGFPANFGS